MRGGALLAIVGLGLVACDSVEVATFSTAQAGMGASSGAAEPGQAAGTAGAIPGGSGGASEAPGGGSAGAGNGGAPEVTCQSTMDCDSDSFCSKPLCASVQGVCLPRPFPDATSSEHVCGCEDQITYWNDSFRQWYGISASTLGVCTQSTQSSCFHDQDCGAVMNVSCAHLLPPNVACGASPGRGQCWVTPRDCLTDEPQHEQICPPPNSGQPPSCATTCQAIQSGHPFTQLPLGQTCSSSSP